MSRIYELLQEVARWQPSAESASNKYPYDADLDGREKEELTKLVRQLFRVPGPVEFRSVVFSGLEQGSGCSWIVTRTARVLASLVTGSVCVVDANLRSPSLHKEFGLDNDHGLADVLLHRGPARECAHCISGGNLWVMTSGCVTSKNKPGITFDTIYSHVIDLRKEFDYIIIDSPPLNTCSDAIVLGRDSDGVVLVLKAHVSRHDTAQKVLRDLAAARVRLLGTVLNQRTFPLPSALYKRL